MISNWTRLWFFELFKIWLLIAKPIFFDDEYSYYGK